MIKPIFNLTPEELEIEAAFESGEIVSRPVTDAEREEWAAMASFTLEKTRAINIRLTEKNLIKVKAAAAREGIPYQTFITSLIHKNT